MMLEVVGGRKREENVAINASRRGCEFVLTQRQTRQGRPSSRAICQDEHELAWRLCHSSIEIHAHIHVLEVIDVFTSLGFVDNEVFSTSLLINKAGLTIY